MVPDFTFLLPQERKKIQRGGNGRWNQENISKWLFLLLYFIFFSSYQHMSFLLQDLCNNGGIFAKWKQRWQSEDNSSAHWSICVSGLCYLVHVELKHTRVIMNDNLLFPQICPIIRIFYFSELKLPKLQASVVIGEQILNLPRHRLTNSQHLNLSKIPKAGADILHMAKHSTAGQFHSELVLTM